MSTLREAAQQALESIDWLRHHLTQHHGCLHMSPTASGIPAWLNKNEAALRAALAQEQAEPVREMPSNTRYTVAVEGQALTYWDSVHDAITHAQRAVYAGVDATTRAIDDLRAGRLAEWSYGFSAVRIYPPQKQAEPVQEPVAWIQPDHLQKARVAPFLCRVEPTQRCPDFVAIYTAPPQRKPLTDEEIKDCFHAARNAKLGASKDNSKHRLSVVEIARAVERAHGIGEQP